MELPEGKKEFLHRPSVRYPPFMKTVPMSVEPKRPVGLAVVVKGENSLDKQGYFA